MVSPVAGLMTGNIFPETDLCHSLLIKIPVQRISGEDCGVGSEFATAPDIHRRPVI